MTETREARLILKGSPCDTNYFDKTLLTIEQAIERGKQYCGNIKICETASIYCALQCGLQVAQYVVKGSNLEKELRDFLEVDFITGEFWNSVDGVEFQRIKGKGKVLRAVEGFARVVLLQDPFKSVFPSCEKCHGVKLEEVVYDSIWDGPFPCSGSGRTKARSVLYCPECDPVPRGGIIKGDPDFEEDLKELRKLSGSKEEK